MVSRQLSTAFPAIKVILLTTTNRARDHEAGGQSEGVEDIDGLVQQGSRVIANFPLL